MRLHFLVFCIAAAVFSTGHATPTKQLGADMTLRTPLGVAFSAPAGWTVETSGNAVILRAPEPDLQVAVVSIDHESSAEAAVLQAWTALGALTVRAAQPAIVVSGHEGWDERRVYTYPTSPNDHLLLSATLLHHEGRWTALLVRGNTALVEKRASSLALISQSLKPEGYKKESFAGRAPHPLDPPRIEAMKMFVQSAMEALGVPGLSMALTDHGQVVFEGGFGVRRLGAPEAVNQHTLFLIASNTKGLSTLLLAREVDAGRVSWDEPVQAVYPAFRLGDKEITRKVLVRNLVCACTGMPRKDLDWALTNRVDTPAETVFEKLAMTRPTSGFGETYQYNNLMAAAAGYLAGALEHPKLPLGLAYDTAMREKIFDPLGMRETTFDFQKVLASNHASPHGFDANGNPALGDISIEQTGIAYRPAGGGWSSAHDLIKYVNLELAEGRLPTGAQFVSRASILMRRAPGVPVGASAFYGMGLITDKTWGVDVIHHGGQMPGYLSDVIIIPNADVGAVILTNSDAGAALLQPFMRRLLEILYDGAPEAGADLADAAARQKASNAVLNSTTPLPPSVAYGLASRYVSPDLGELTIVKDGAGQTILNVGLISTHVGLLKSPDGVLSLVPSDPIVPRWPFVISREGAKRTLTVSEAQHGYTFVEQSP